MKSIKESLLNSLNEGLIDDINVILGGLVETKHTFNKNENIREYLSNKPVRPGIVKLCRKYGNIADQNTAQDAIKNGDCIYAEELLNGRVYTIRIIFPSRESDDTLVTFVMDWPKQARCFSSSDNILDNPGMFKNNTNINDDWNFYVMPDDIKKSFREFCNL